MQLTAPTTTVIGQPRPGTQQGLVRDLGEIRIGFGRDTVEYRTEHLNVLSAQPVYLAPRDTTSFNDALLGAQKALLAHDSVADARTAVALLAEGNTWVAQPIDVSDLVIRSIDNGGAQAAGMTAATLRSLDVDLAALVTSAGHIDIDRDVQP